MGTFILKRGLFVLVFLLLYVPFSVFSQRLIRVNQIGYISDAPKVATVANMDASNFEVKDFESGQIVYRGNLGKGKFWSQSNENIQKIDFSEFKKPGKYVLQVDEEISFPFVISNSSDIFHDLSVASIRAFYYWRSSCELKAPYSVFKGVDYARPLGHPDTLVFIHQSAATEKRPVGFPLSSPKGWYDAGDYNKYVVNAGITLHQMVLSYEMFSAYYDTLSLNIPKDDTTVCDFFNELKWEYDWLFTMQDPYDGGVYHKLTTLRFCSFVMPDKDDADRYMVKKSTAATLDFAAEMAMCARVFRDKDSAYADKALKAAVRAWEWAERNPNVLFDNPEDVRTGSYADNKVEDEFFWAATELFITTGEKKYYDKLDFFQQFEGPTWRDVASLGLMSLVYHKDQLPDYVDQNKITVKFKSLASTIYNLFKYASGRVALKKFEWGGNGTIASNGAILGLAYHLFKEKKYNEAMLANFDYLLGANPTEYCFVSCFGSKYPKNFHDRRIGSDGIDEPIPGYVCGGANTNRVSDCGAMSYPSNAPARCYLDDMCSFSTNEIAINWNAPLVLLVAMVYNMH